MPIFYVTDYDSSRIGKPFFGALVGRVANRIGGSKFNLDGKTYNLNANNDGNHLHGGLEGWDRVSCLMIF